VFYAETLEQIQKDTAEIKEDTKEILKAIEELKHRYSKDEKVQATRRDDKELVRKISQQYRSKQSMEEHLANLSVRKAQLAGEIERMDEGWQIEKRSIHPPLDAYIVGGFDKNYPVIAPFLVVAGLFLFGIGWAEVFEPGPKVMGIIMCFGGLLATFVSLIWLALRHSQYNKQFDEEYIQKKRPTSRLAKLKSEKRQTSLL
jgi:hypothetical protein